MSQVKLSKTQLAILDAIIADAQEKGITTLGGNSDCWFDCIVNVAKVVVPVVVETVAGAGAKNPQVSVAKLIEYRKAH